MEKLWTKVTPKYTPSSVTPKPITPIIANITKDLEDEDSFLSFTSRKTNEIDNNQLTINPTKKPNAVAIIKDQASQAPLSINDGGNINCLNK